MAGGQRRGEPLFVGGSMVAILPQIQPFDSGTVNRSPSKPLWLWWPFSPGKSGKKNGFIFIHFSLRLRYLLETFPLRSTQSL